MAEQMRLEEKLEHLLDKFTQCQIVAFTDLSTGTVLYSKARAAVRQEKLDSLCGTAAEMLEGETAHRVIRAVPHIRGSALSRAIIVERNEIGLFLRSGKDSTEALCCVCAQGVDLGDFVRSVQDTIELPTGDPSVHNGHKPMSDLKVLQDRIEILSQDTEIWFGNRRKIFNSDHSDPIGAMLREISETSSRRGLVFRNDQDLTLGLEVSAGRIHRLMDVTSEEFEAIRPEFVTRQLSGENDEEIAYLSEIISSFYRAAKEISVETRLLEIGRKGVGIGIPESSLRSALAPLPPRHNHLSNPAGLDGFVEIASPHSTALLKLDQTRVSLQQGPDSHIELLKELATAENSATNDVVEHHPGQGQLDSCIVLTGPWDRGHGILCAATSGRSIFLTFESGDFQKILDLWQHASVHEAVRPSLKKQARAL